MIVDRKDSYLLSLMKTKYRGLKTLQLDLCSMKIRLFCPLSEDPPPFLLENLTSQEQKAETARLFGELQLLQSHICISVKLVRMSRCTSRPHSLTVECWHHTVEGLVKWELVLQPFRENTGCPGQDLVGNSGVCHSLKTNLKMVGVLTLMTALSTELEFMSYC